MFRDSLCNILRKSLRLSYFKNVRSLSDAISSNSNLDTSIKSPKISSRAKPHIQLLCNCDDPENLHKCSKSARCQYRVDQVPVFIKTYGCQMNENDTSIVGSILEEYGYRITQDFSEAEIHLLMTCAIRESAEGKIWAKLRELKHYKDDESHPLKQIGLLGCMAERLKEKVLDTSNSVDIVAGPDAYRDLPRLFAVNKMSKEKAINCLLSFDETYSDIRPVTKVNDVTSFISITRGCDNLCSYCIVPFTRGRERSRPLNTIVDEARSLFSKGIREVTLLGQNVNSYRDTCTRPEDVGRSDLVESIGDKENFADGFKTVYKPRTKGLTFDVLLEEVAKISPELRVRFTSPHPKDFTDDVIDVIAKYPNISKCIHLPAQSGSDKILEKMRRGYTKKAYLDLVDRMRQSIPNLALTTDIIAGFCGETECDHQETMDLVRKVWFNYVFAFPYSMRDKTHAFHRFTDDVDIATKKRRTGEILELFREQALLMNKRLVGSEQLVLIESETRRSEADLLGRTDTNIKTIVPRCEVISHLDDCIRPIKPGDYVVCMISEANSQTLKAIPMNITSQENFRGSSYLEID